VNVVARRPRRAALPGSRPSGLRWPLRAAALTAFAVVSGCLRWQPAPVPMPTLALRVSPPPHHRLVLLLPGRGGSPDNFVYAEFAAIAAQGRLPADLISADARLSYYYRGTLVERLRQDVIAPAQAHGYDQIFLVGVSLGSATALLYVDQHPEGISGILLLSPFLGQRQVVDEVAAAGSLAQWSPPAAPTPADFQRQLWRVLKRLTGGGSSMPLYLGYSDHDHFLVSDRLLASALPAGHVFITPGHHDWPTWKKLWADFLAAGVLK
jgi:pimeloyl-ACP methyl ester carboxylesterase